MSYVTPSETNATFYADYPVTGTNWGSGIHPITPMMLDILAAQPAVRSGDIGPACGGQRDLRVQHHDHRPDQTLLRFHPEHTARRHDLGLRGK
jgi:hypothetical protein